MSVQQMQAIARAREILRERGWTRGAGVGGSSPTCAGVALSIASGEIRGAFDGSYLTQPVYEELKERGFNPSIAHWNDIIAEGAEAVDELLAAAERRAA